MALEMHHIHVFGRDCCPHPECYGAFERRASRIVALKLASLVLKAEPALEPDSPAAKLARMVLDGKLWEGEL